MKVSYVICQSPPFMGLIRGNIRIKWLRVYDPNQVPSHKTMPMTREMRSWVLGFTELYGFQPRTVDCPGWTCRPTIGQVHASAAFARRGAQVAAPGGIRSGLPSCRFLSAVNIHVYLSRTILAA
jgi:hypothetical protein